MRRSDCYVVLLALLALGLAGCRGGHATAPGHGSGARAHVARGGADGVRYAIPAGWHAARHSLTPHLLNPRELLTVGTGPLPARPGGACAHLPVAALRAMRPNDVLVTVQERFGSPRTFPPRPRRFMLPATRSEAEQCAGPQEVFASHLLEFRDRGRGFHALIAVGRAAPAARVREALTVLDSLRIARRPPARIDPDDAIPYEDPARGLQLVHPSAWQLYPRALTQAIPARDQIALGTFPLHQRHPDSNCTPATALRVRRPGDGFLFVFEYEGLNRRQLARFPKRPARLRSPRSSYRPYECMGPSRLVRFRDGDRAFQAHIYGPPRRRRQALTILDTLRVR